MPMSHPNHNYRFHSTFRTPPPRVPILVRQPIDRPSYHDNFPICDNPSGGVITLQSQFPQRRSQQVLYTINISMLSDQFMRTILQTYQLAAKRIRRINRHISMPYNGLIIYISRRSMINNDNISRAIPNFIRNHPIRVPNQNLA